MHLPRGERPTPPTHLGARAAALAAEQRGVLTRRQLHGLGCSDATISAMAARGQLVAVWPGVHAHGHAVLSREGWWMAAVLACGPGARLSGRASAAARGLLPAWSTIDVATPTKRGVALDGIRAHRVSLRPEERDVHRGLPVTSLARTALDVAASDGSERVGDVLDGALLHGQYDHAEMLDLLHHRRGCRGVAVLRIAVEALGPEGVVFRSRPERRARDLLRATDLPQPRVNAWFPTRAGHGYELDLWLPDLRLDLELDGPHHAMPHQRARDARRDEDLARFGVTVVRIPTSIVMDEPERFLILVRDAVSAHGHRTGQS